MLEFLCAGTDAYNRFALEAGRAIDNKKDLSTSKLVSSPLLLSEPLIYVRAVSCPDRKSVHTRCRALCSFIKNTGIQAILIPVFFIHSRTALVVRDYCGCLPMYARIPPST